MATLDNLSDREKEVLKYVVENFIRSANPIGSRSVSRQTDLHLSSATIRNVMCDLEEMDLLGAPHTSAGRIPTDRGYRYYVDVLMENEKLSNLDERSIKARLEEANITVVEKENLYAETSKILGKVARLLAVVSEPNISKGIFQKLEFVKLSSNKILVVINILSGIIKTVILEVDSDISKQKLDTLASTFNERYHGLALNQIRELNPGKLHDYRQKESGVINKLINSFEKMNAEDDNGSKIFVGGTGDVILQPEFENPRNFKDIIELAEDRNLVIHIFQNNIKSDNDMMITIGSENDDEKLKNYSVVTTTYNVGEVKGNIEVIGPKRMNYARMISLLKFTSKLINEISGH